MAYSAANDGYGVKSFLRSVLMGGTPPNKSCVYERESATNCRSTRCSSDLLFRNDAVMGHSPRLLSRGGPAMQGAVKRLETVVIFKVMEDASDLERAIDAI